MPSSSPSQARVIISNRPEDYGLPAHLGEVDVARINELERGVEKVNGPDTSHIPVVVPMNSEGDDEEDDSENTKKNENVHPGLVNNDDASEDKENVNPRLEEEDNKENVDPRVDGEDKENIAPESHFKPKLEDDAKDRSEADAKNEQGFVVWSDKQSVKSEEPITTPTFAARLGERVPLAPIRLVLGELAPEPETKAKFEALGVYDNDKEQGFVVWTGSADATGNQDDVDSKESKEFSAIPPARHTPLAPMGPSNPSDERSSSPIPPALARALNDWDNTETDDEHDPGFVVWTGKQDDDEGEGSRSSSRALSDWDDNESEHDPGFVVWTGKLDDDDEEDSRSSSRALSDWEGAESEHDPGFVVWTGKQDEDDEDKESRPIPSALARALNEWDESDVEDSENNDDENQAKEEGPFYTRAPQRTPLGPIRVILGDLPCTPPREAEPQTPTFSALTRSENGDVTVEGDALDDEEAFYNAPSRRTPFAIRGRVILGDLTVSSESEPEETEREEEGPQTPTPTARALAAEGLDVPANVDSDVEGDENAESQPYGRDAFYYPRRGQKRRGEDSGNEQDEEGEEGEVDSEGEERHRDKRVRGGLEPSMVLGEAFVLK